MSRQQTGGYMSRLAGQGGHLVQTRGGGVHTDGGVRGYKREV